MANSKHGASFRGERVKQIDEIKGAITQSVADWGYAGHERGNEASDRVQTEAYPYQPRPRSAYLATTGDAPTLRAGDVVGARTYLDKINLAIEKGGWTRCEWRRLTSLRTKWLLRAEGKDKRFNLVGNRKCGLTREQRFELGCGVTLDEIKDSIRSNTTAVNVRG